MSHGILINGTDDIATIQDDCHYVDLEDCQDDMSILENLFEQNFFFV